MIVLGQMFHLQLDVICFAFYIWRQINTMSVVLVSTFLHKTSKPYSQYLFGVRKKSKFTTDITMFTWHLLTWIGILNYVEFLFVRFNIVIAFVVRFIIIISEFISTKVRSGNPLKNSDVPNLSNHTVRLLFLQEIN